MQIPKNKTAPKNQLISRLSLRALIILTILMTGFLGSGESVSAAKNSKDFVRLLGRERNSGESQTNILDPNQSAGSRFSVSSPMKIYLPLISAATIYYVSPSGDNRNPGSQSRPWHTIQKAVNAMVAGDTTIVLPGTYNEQVEISTSGIILQAQGKVITKGVYISGNSNTLRGFTITDPTSDWGVMTSGSHNRIEGNEIYHTKQDGIWFFGSYNTFRGNYIHDILDPSIYDTHNDCFQTWGWDWDTTNVLFEKNICKMPVTANSDNQQIVMLERKTTAAVRDITFRDNIFVIYNPSFAILDFWYSSGQGRVSNITVVNNTIVNMNQKRAECITFYNVDNATAINNLFINCGDSYTPYIDRTGSTNVNIHNNSVYSTYGALPKGTPYPNDIWGKDPRFANLSSLDFHLLADSPSINNGSNIGNLVSDDLDGVTRPQGGRYDIGAYEFLRP